MIWKLRNPVREYAWGSPSVIPHFCGYPQSGRPQAELWMSAHEADSSTLEPDGRELAEAIADGPADLLGDQIALQFDGRLPFLVKFLGIGQPLSLQAHPSAEQARAGFEAQNAAGIPLRAHERTYTDPWPKPEVLVALAPTEALAGFAPIEHVLDLFDAMDLADLAGTAERLRGEDVAGAVAGFLHSDRDRLRPLIAGIARSLRGLREHGRFGPAAQQLRALAQDFPDDPGVPVACLMNHVTLAPGQALRVSAGMVHAYLSGFGLETLANSDNVLRAGLTRKHIDPDELLRIADFTPGSAEVFDPGAPQADGWVAYPSDRFFTLRRAEFADAATAAPSDVDRPGGTTRTLPGAGPQIVVVTAGTVTLPGVQLGRGESAFVAAGQTDVEVQAVHGPATVFVVGMDVESAEN